MFDISFFELLVVGVVGLIVIGPERLPGAARTCALWIGRIKRSIANTRAELEKQLGADEIRRELHNEQVLYNLEKMKQERLDLEARIRALEPFEPVTPESQAPESQTTESQAYEHQTAESQAAAEASAPAIPDTHPSPPAKSPDL